MSKLKGISATNQEKIGGRLLYKITKATKNKFKHNLLRLHIEIKYMSTQRLKEIDKCQCAQCC